VGTTLSARKWLSLPCLPYLSSVYKDGFIDSRSTPHREKYVVRYVVSPIYSTVEAGRLSVVKHVKVSYRTGENKLGD
jgi:hypothetical protein